MKFSTSLFAITAIILFALPGCTVGPDYKKPETTLPQNWVSTDKSGAATIDQAWWQNFHDPILTQLIEKAAAGNPDLKIAEMRIKEARATRSQADATLLPSGDFKATGEREANQIAFPGKFPGANLATPFDVFQSGFDATWELDLFGGHRRDIESANASLEASEASRDDAMVSLMAEVARTYIDIRQYQAQLATAEDTVEADRNTVAIAKERFEAGDAPQLDMTQAQAQQEQDEAQVPYQRNMLAQAEFSMDVLLGAQPGATKSIVDTPAPIPTSDKELVLAAPAAVIANRPDIRVAERKLAAATAQQGVAVAKFFPDISLSGFAGFLNVHADDLLRRQSESWMMGGSVVWPILSYGTLSANLDAANAEQQEAMANWQKTVITALIDVEKSVKAYSEQEQFRESLAHSLDADRHAADIAGERYKEGITSFLEVLDARRTLYVAQNHATEADAKAAQNLVAVYKSLGGGWQAPGQTSATTSAPVPAATKTP